MRRTTTAAIVATLAITMTGFAAVPASAAGAAAVCSGATLSTADLATGCTVDPGTTLALPDGRTVVVPAPGTTLTVAPVVVAGAEDPGDLVVANAGAAGVAVRTEGAWSGSPAAVTRERAALQRRVLGATVAAPGAVTTGAGATASCGSTAYSLTGHHWAGAIEWRYNPANAKASNVSALRAGADAWTGSITSCGRTVTSTAAEQYLGTAKQAPALTDQGGCGAANRYSVTGWGALPTGTLGVTCVWSRSGVAVEMDQRYSTRYLWASTATCSGNRYDFRGVATHEWGHAYGLGHVDQATGQVMKSSATTCDVAQRTLGAGDARGISTLY
ncbi:hypothetical protein DEJ16_06250 [Curtobacterium sp. MCJR17_055]|uniref:matrixin family metalloprotease n=1 Tax=unclassified Curtobacterium TaxID=257496 RepID=UPI000D81637C|nr:MULTISPECIES: matrixin family metalloprotease [unclassified Curtobacterium]PYY37923.1 hypothetical protein DEI87_02005 [Curtobacterium sp. MCBD17_029]PYY56950.1 hypothetical protein DEJ16_06250 [Curtobacterium sp. MCJR17_055]PYY62135.1 hypothetical protein DEJ26_01275 [Curtobacterium sp. MCPF17_015]